MSSESHFERLIDAEMEKLLQASIRVIPGESHEHARIVGKYQGLGDAKRVYREAAGLDIDADDI